jgi:hypothetical protein
VSQVFLARGKDIRPADLKKMVKMKKTANLPNLPAGICAAKR